MFTLRTEVGRATDNPRTLAKLARIGLELTIANNRVTFREYRRRTGRRFPRLYTMARKGRVRYEREREEGEEFADALTVLGRGWGDCDDLICWRIAELREAGENATVIIYARPRANPDDGWKMHCQLRRANGRIEDPSRFMGL